MRVLAIETSSAIGSVALLDDASVVAEVTEAVPMHHLEWLVPTIEGVLGAAGWDPKVIAGLGVSQGPGSFMGVRVGIATAGAWAMARQIPVVGVPTLAALALGVDVRGWICPLVDVRRGEVAAALFQRDGGLRRESEDFIAPLDVLLARLPEASTVTFVGDGLARYGGAIQRARGAQAALAPTSAWIPRASVVGRLAWERLSRSERDDLYTLLPIYSRQAVGEA